MRARTEAWIIGVLLTTMCAASCSSSSSSNASQSTTTTSASGESSNPSDTSKPTVAPVQPLDRGELHRVLAEWTQRNDTHRAVVGVEVGDRAPSFAVTGSGSAQTTAAPTPTSTFRIGNVSEVFLGALTLQLAAKGDLDLDATIDRWLPKVPNAATITLRALLTAGDESVNVSRLGDVIAAASHSDLGRALQTTLLDPLGLHHTSYDASLGAMLSTPSDLLAFSASYFRAHVRGQHDIGSSYFRVGPSGTGLGVEGISNDGFCAVSAHGCPADTTFSALGAVGAVPGGSAVVAYYPAYDLSVVALASSEQVDVVDLAERAALLAELGTSRYEKTVGFTAHAASTTIPN